MAGWYPDTPAPPRCSDLSTIVVETSPGCEAYEKVECQHTAIGNCPKCQSEMCADHIAEHLAGDFCEPPVPVPDLYADDPALD